MIARLAPGRSARLKIDSKGEFEDLREDANLWTNSGAGILTFSSGKGTITYVPVRWPQSLPDQPNYPSPKSGVIHVPPQSP